MFVIKFYSKWKSVVIVCFGKEKVWPSSHRLVVKAEDSRPRGPGFKPPLWRPLFRHHSFGSKLGKKLWKTLTWHCCMCCNPANGRVDFEEWSAYKIQVHGIEWIVSFSADWDQSPTKKKKKKKRERKCVLHSLRQDATNLDVAKRKSLTFNTKKYFFRN